MKTSLILISGLLLFEGCASDAPQAAVEKPPRFEDKVEVLIYDDTPRPPTAHLDIYEDNKPERKYKVIALITCEGAPKDEAPAVTAIFYRARQIGAEAVMGADTVTTEQENSPLLLGRNAWGFAGAGGARCVYRAKAIVYEDK